MALLISLSRTTLLTGPMPLLEVVAVACSVLADAVFFHLLNQQISYSP